MKFEEAVQAVQSESLKHCREYQETIAWQETIDSPASIVWLPSNWIVEQAESGIANALVSSPIRARIDEFLNGSEIGQVKRGTYALCDRVAMPAAVSLLPHIGELGLEDPYLTHTPLGQPTIQWRQNGDQSPDIQISYTHDGDSHLTLVATAPELLGVGIDVVHLPRMRSDRKDRAYFMRFARHFMSEEEYESFAESSATETHEHTLERVSAHFSLMEAASKAVGTGLKIGGGMGRPESLPKQSLGVKSLRPNVEFMIRGEAQERIAELGGRSLRGYWGSDGVYLVSAVFLWGDESRKAEVSSR